MNFVIWSLDYNWRSGGIVVLHKLAELLANAGHETYCVSESTSSGNRATLVGFDEAARLVKDGDAVAIYPEIVSGNPLGAVKVARWVLYYPGFHGGDKEYDDTEFVFTFNSSFVAGSKYADAPVVRIIETMREHFFDMKRPRSKDAILQRKGKDETGDRVREYFNPHLSELYELLSVDDLIKSCAGPEEFNVALNEIRYFISFDSVTYNSIIAALAGCVSIVIPSVGVTREQYFESNPGLKNGIAYGFADIEHQVATRVDLIKGLDQAEAKNLAAMERFVAGVNEFFGSSRPR